jgi:hypothetical protein
MIIAMAIARSARLGALAASVALVAGGCGSGRLLDSTTAAHASRRSVVSADPGALNVIKAWSDALRRGDVRGAANYFALPSELVNGIGASGQPELFVIRTLAVAAAANETLPCGARLISASRQGRYISAVFRLTNRPGPGGGGCGSGAGQTARTDFLISAGRIVEWIRAPDQPGDNDGSGSGSGSGGSNGPAPAPTTPATTTGPLV